MELGVPISSKSNARVKTLRASFSGRAARPGELLGIEGEHLVAEALRSGVKLEMVFVRAGSEAVLQRTSLAGLRAKHWVLLSADVFASAVETASPQGIAATIAIPEPMVAHETRGVALVIEGLQDPGNLGTLLRSAEAFGAVQVLVTPETVNQWNPKVVRASAGSVFRVPVIRAPLKEIRQKLKDSRLIAAVVQSHGAVSLLKSDLAASCALMIGNEGAGLSAEALALADMQVWIPCEVESLNAAVAGSALLYEAMRQREARR
jgi:TrmH family RNA methyltransferase